MSISARQVLGFGPTPAPIAFVGEAPGEQEDARGEPFVGPAGDLLEDVAARAGLHIRSCFRTNVFSRRPANNDWASAYCSPKLDQKRALAALDPADKRALVDLGIEVPIRSGAYLRPEFAPELLRLHAELAAAHPNIVCALGNVACWALLRTTAISRLRGTVAAGLGRFTGFKVLPTYHPAAVLRDYSLRPVVTLDLLKLARESIFPGIRRTPREITIIESPGELQTFLEPYTFLACDVETSHRQITCIGFGCSPRKAAVVGFVDRRGRSLHSPEVELALWNEIRTIVSDPNRSLVFQNGLYDIQYLWRAHRIAPRAARHDTMIAHHAMYPELTKDLGFLASIYCNEPAWKQLASLAHSETKKADDN